MPWLVSEDAWSRPRCGCGGPSAELEGAGPWSGGSRAPPQRPSHALGVAEDAHGEVLDMRWPLRCQLEKLHVVPLHPIYGH